MRSFCIGSAHETEAQNWLPWIYLGLLLSFRNSTSLLEPPGSTTGYFPSELAQVNASYFLAVSTSLGWYTFMLKCSAKRRICLKSFHILLSHRPSVVEELLINLRFANVWRCPLSKAPAACNFLFEYEWWELHPILRSRSAFGFENLVVTLLCLHLLFLCPLRFLKILQKSS